MPLKDPEVEQVVACSSVRNSNVAEGELTYLTGEIYANMQIFSVCSIAQRILRPSPDNVCADSGTLSKQ